MTSPIGRRRRRHSLRGAGFRKILPLAVPLVAVCITMITIGIGCYRSPDTTWYEPHVYKGSDDPLMDKIDEGGLHTQLEARFQAVQTDR